MPWTIRHHVKMSDISMVIKDQNASHVRHRGYVIYYEIDAE